MRGAGQAKMGYYPTPERLVPLIRSHLAFPPGEFAALDPFAGTGAALADLVQGTEACTYGVELDAERAKMAKERLHRVVHGDFMAARVSREAFSLLYFNPPYDWAAKSSEEARAERKEALYFRRAIELLVPGGVFVGLIPEIRLGDVARLYATRLADVRVFRFPQPEYAAFRQVVVFGVRRRHPQRDKETEELLFAAATGLWPAPDLSLQEAPLYHVPETPARVPVFWSGVLLAEDAAEVESASPLWREVGQLFRGGDAMQVRQPPLPLHTGHQALLLASGALDGVMGTGPQRHLVRGQVVKTTTTVTEYEEGPDGELVEVTRETESYEVRVRLLTADGQHIVLS